MTAAGTRRKTKPASQRTSALHALRASGLVGMFAGSPALASGRKRLLKEKLRGEASASSRTPARGLPDLARFRAGIRVKGKPTSRLVIEERRKA